MLRPSVRHSRHPAAERLWNSQIRLDTTDIALAWGFAAASILLMLVIF